MDTSVFDRQKWIITLAETSQLFPGGKLLEQCIGPGFQLQFTPNQRAETTGLPSRNFMGLLASHFSKNDFLSPAWQSSLLVALRYAQEQHASILIPDTAPAAESIFYACEQLDLPAFRVAISPNSDFVATQMRSDQSNQRANPKSANKNRSFPGDLAVTFCSNELVALSIRPGGTVADCVRKRLESSIMPPHSIRIIVPDLVTTKQKQILCEFNHQGAVLWFPNPSPNKIVPYFQTLSAWHCSLRPTPHTQQPVSPLPESLFTSTDYLIHCTRARQSCWPDQSPLDLLNEAFRLAFNPSPAPLDTLCRILTTQRLVASSLHRRGNQPTVCFTENTLADLQSMRSFQSHLARWDWEPYGVAIPTTWLARLGARPVRYLPPEKIDRLSDDEQCFSQPIPATTNQIAKSHHTTTSKKALRVPRDWSIEKEWRLLGDLRFHQLHHPEVQTPQACSPFVFVLRQAEAQAIADRSRWPVYWLEDRL